MTTVLTETRERFLLAIVKQVPADRIAEIHFFQPMKQGGVESGVAVVAAWPAESHPERSEGSPETAEEAHAAVEGDPSVEDDATSLPQDDSEPREVRPVIYTARYRLTLKGPERGKWETNVVAEADAPLVTLDAVVRGVQRRAGDVDDATRMEGDEVRAIVQAKMQSMLHGVPGGSVSANP